MAKDSPSRDSRIGSQADICHAFQCAETPRAANGRIILHYGFEMPLRRHQTVLRATQALSLRAREQRPSRSSQILQYFATISAMAKRDSSRSNAGQQGVVGHWGLLAGRFFLQQPNVMQKAVK